MEKYGKDIVEEMNGHGELEVGDQRHRVAYTFSLLQDQSLEPACAGDSSQQRRTINIVGRIKAPSRAALIEIASSHEPVLHLSDGRRFILAVKPDGTAVATCSTAEYPSAVATPARVPAAPS